MDKVFLLSIALAASLVLANAAKTSFATYSYGDTIIIHSDGSVTPDSAPVTRSGNTYVVTEDILMPRSTNEGIKVEKDNIVLDGAGHKVTGNGQSSAIYMKGRVGVTITRFSMENFYWGLEIWNSKQCIISGNNLTAVMYCIYLQASSENKFHHNNIFGSLYYMNSSNIWDNGYPSGGNYWEGYPYADVKSGVGQNLPGSDGIGDKLVGEEIFSQGGSNVDNYPLMAMQSIANYNPSLDVASGSAEPVVTSTSSPESSSVATANPTPSPSVPEFPSTVLVGIIIISTIAAALFHNRKAQNA